MNAATKTALIFVFALGVIHLLLLIIGAMSGTPADSDMVLGLRGITGRNSMWIPVFMWAWIPTTMMLAIGGLLVWVSVKYRPKKEPMSQYQYIDKHP